VIVRRAPRRTRRAALLTGALLVPLAVAPAAAGLTTGPDGCTSSSSPVVARAELRADLDGDGSVTAAERIREVSDDRGADCRRTDAWDAGALPVAVGILHTTPAEGALEAGQLGEATAPVTTRVAVRDRTATPHEVSVDVPGGTEVRERRVAVPHLVRIGITYPRSWTTVAPGAAGVRTDVVDGGVHVAITHLLFPPVTSDEVVLPVTADPGRGAPTVSVEAIPVTDEETVRLAADELDRDAAAVVAALTEAGAEGAEQLADGAAELADGIDGLAAGNRQLADGLAEAAAGGAELRAGADQLAAGARQLAIGARQLAVGMRPLADGARQVAEGNRRMAEQLSVAADGADALADGNEELADGAEELGAGSRRLADGAEALREALAGLPDLGPVSDEIVGPAEELIAGAEATARAGERLEEGNREVARGNRELADGLREAAGGSRELAEGSEQVADGIDQAAGGADALADGSQQLADGADELSDGVDAYTRGVEEAAAGSERLAAGAGAAADGADDLADGAAELPEALHQATETADRENVRRAEHQAVLAVGRELADDAVRAEAGDAPTRTLTTELVAAGDDPVSPWVWAAVAALVLAAVGLGRAWWQQRGEVAP
jgi:X-X-X-Leu-X-X-Gly heptad repeat protein